MFFFDAEKFLTNRNSEEIRQSGQSLEKLRQYTDKHLYPMLGKYCLLQLLPSTLSASFINHKKPEAEEKSAFQPFSDIGRTLKSLFYTIPRKAYRYAQRGAKKSRFTSLLYASATVVCGGIGIVTNLGSKLLWYGALSFISLPLHLITNKHSSSNQKRLGKVLLALSVIGVACAIVFWPVGVAAAAAALLYTLPAWIPFLIAATSTLLSMGGRLINWFTSPGPSKGRQENTLRANKPNSKIPENGQLITENAITQHNIDQNRQGSQHNILASLKPVIVPNYCQPPSSTTSNDNKVSPPSPLTLSNSQQSPTTPPSDLSSRKNSASSTCSSDSNTSNNSYYDSNNSYYDSSNELESDKTSNLASDYGLLFKGLNFRKLPRKSSTGDNSVIISDLSSTVFNNYYTEIKDNGHTSSPG